MDKARKEGKEEGSGSSKGTLSGLLNFIDGLWSACGGARQTVFTTNYEEKVDPALIRRGRMDKHIELSYCRFEALKVLAKNYLNVESHPMFETISGLMKDIKISPADDAENLRPISPLDNAERSFSSLVQALKEAKEEAARRNAEKEEAERKKTEQEEELKKTENEVAAYKQNGVSSMKEYDAAQSRENKATENSQMSS